MLIGLYFCESGGVDLNPDTDMKTFFLLKRKISVLQIWLLATSMHLNSFNFQDFQCRQIIPQCFFETKKAPETESHQLLNVSK